MRCCLESGCGTYSKKKMLWCQNIINGWSGIISEVESERDFSIWWRDLRLVCGSRSEAT